ncbi:cyclin-like protein [Radiomyces spectabilis]|uniref:cyclin-like protein n=1 Tax=Radiomyces spectabilis TaxID=64574 RepID=UPI00221FC1FA|nr:cyclin-like protein [Radiomyces spectabilis]KAI8373086.1 cyclin-like protein [Radiomyces spectabilis]
MSGSSPISSNVPSTPVSITMGSAFRRRYHPYMTKRQLATLNSLKKSSHLAVKENAARNSSCKFIQEVGKKLGFPQTTISTSQALYHRFYLYYSIRDYSPQDISVTCLFVASKIEETIKKLKDIFVAVHSVKYPDSKELDPENVSEERRRRIIGYEKLLLETLCFDFQFRHPYEYVAKFVKWIQAFQPLDGKRLARKAYSLAVDSYRTQLCVEYPAHTIAAGCIYLSSRLLKEEDKDFRGLTEEQPWDQLFLSRMEDIEDVCQQILDLYIMNNRGDVTLYTRMKIELNEQAHERGPDPDMDEITRQELKSRPSDWEFEGMSPLDVVNTNQHTVSYHFANSST